MTEAPAADSRQKGIIDAPWPVVALIAAMAIIHLALYLGGEGWQDWAFAVFAFIPAVVSGGVAEMVPGSAWWRFLTHAFLHGDWMHLLFNCIWLLVFGTVTARRLGAVRFFALFLISVLGGAAATLARNWGEVIFLIGASGGVSGLLAAAIPVMYGRKRHSDHRALGPLELFTDRPALMFMALWLGLTLVSGSTGLLVPGQPGNIAWEAHLGGFVAGLLAFYLLGRRPIAPHPEL